MEIIRFGTNDALNILQREPHRIDTLPYGAVLLDKHGNIQRYNAAEAKLSGYRSSDVVGKNFFNEVAPCSKKQPIYEWFEKFQTGEHVDIVVRYAIELAHGTLDVKVHLRSTGDDCWLFLKRA